MRAAAVAIIGILTLAACAGAPKGETPAWLADTGGGGGYPSLRDVPRLSDANTDAAHWAAMQVELMAVGAAVQSNPRAQPVAEADNPTLFLEQARAELEQARQAHE